MIFLRSSASLKQKNGMYMVNLLKAQIEFDFFVIIRTTAVMNTLPEELVALIAIDTFELFTTLLKVPTVGLQLSSLYAQFVARKKFITTTSDIFGTYIYLNDRLHSFNNYPAVIYTSSAKKWYKYGKLHREHDLPAIEFSDNSKFWYWHGKRHRENDLPAIEWSSGTKGWYQYDKRHRGSNLPAIEFSDGSKAYYVHGVSINYRL
jgi:hypothetical protein